MAEREFWAVEDRERLVAETPDEAFEECLDDLVPGLWPDEMTARQFKPMKVFLSHPDWVLEGILENLDEEYGNPDGDDSKPTEAMKKAADNLLKIVVQEYVSWNCEPTGEIVSVVTEDWIKKYGYSDS